MNKIFQLLKKKDKNYSLKRKNIEKTTYNFDENNNLYLTLPKFDYGKRIREQINERKKFKDESTISKSKVIAEQSIDNSRHNLEELIPEFFQNNNTKSDESEHEFKIDDQDNDSLNSSLNEDEKKALFEKLKTRNKFISGTNQKFSLKKSHKNESEDFIHVKNSHSISDNKLLRGNFSVFTSQNKNNLRPKIPNTKSLLEDDPLFRNFKIMKEKLAIIKKHNNKKKKTVIAADIFYYDKKKWEIQRIKESDRIVRRLEEVEHKRKDWNDKHIPDLNLPNVPLSELRNELKRNSINRKFTKGGSILFSNRDIFEGMYITVIIYQIFRRRKFHRIRCKRSE
jgi:hypothetical protein